MGLQKTVPEVIKPTLKTKTNKKKKKKKLSNLLNGAAKKPEINGSEHVEKTAATCKEHSVQDTDLFEAADQPVCSAADSKPQRDTQLLDNYETRDSHVTGALTNGAAPHHTATIESSPGSPRDSPALLACNYGGSSASLEHCTEVNPSFEPESVSFCSDPDPANQNTDPNVSASSVKRKLKRTSTTTSDEITAKKKKRKKKNSGNAVDLNKSVVIVDQAMNIGKRSDTLNAKEEAKQLFQWLIHPVKSDQFFK